MFLFLIQRYQSSLNYLNHLSSLVRSRTYAFGPLFYAPQMSTQKSSSHLKFDLKRLSEVLVVSCLLIVLSVLSRGAQFDYMAENLGDYFLPNLKNVSTTHDAGFYLFQAQEIRSKLLNEGQIEAIDPGALLGFFLAQISILFEVSLEEAGRYFVYGSVALTAFSAYVILRVLGEGILSVLVASSLIFFFPVYGRTSLGMVDTDQLNLFFILAISAGLIASARARSFWLVLLWAALSGALCQAFLLWYPRPGFLLGFLSAYVLTILSFGTSLRALLLASTTFLSFAGFGNVTAAWGSLASFLGSYFLPLSSGGNDLLSLGAEAKGAIWPTIAELTPLTTGLLENDYGAAWVFYVAIIGVLIWFAQDWRRGASLSILLAFGVLYILSGQRFSFYFSLLPLLGLFVASSNLVYFGSRLVVSALKESSPRNPTESQPDVLSRGQGTSRSRAITLGVLIFMAAWWPFSVLPPLGVTPPPVIWADEIKFIRDTLQRTENKPFFVASWWDYGHELRFQTGGDPLTDGSDPANLKNIYIARALVSPDPYYAADEIRFAAYFEQSTLLHYFPKRPDVSLSENAERHIYVILPSDLQQKMLTVYNVAVKSMPNEYLVNYSAQASTFYTLYHRSPATFGPFRLVGSQPDGAKIYLLPGVKLPK